MQLSFNRIVKITEEQRAIKDRRFKITRTIVSYTGADGEEYRKGYESKGEPNIVKKGSLKEINNSLKQY